MKNKLLEILTACLMIVVLATALIYYNFIDKAPVVETSAEYGYTVGKICYDMDRPLLNKLGTAFSDSFNINDTKGKITVINFWFTSCTPCVQEMPYFAQLADKYADELVVVAYHADLGDEQGAIDYVKNNWSDYNILFAYDTADYNADIPDYYTKLGGNGMYPRTLVLDENNVVVAEYQGSVTYAMLDADVKSILNRN